MEKARALQPGVEFELHHIHLFYVLTHVACVAAFFLTGDVLGGLALATFFYVVRSLGLVVGYHRYFAHRSFKTSRPMQLLLALAGSFSAQRGVLWWAQTHRHHHRHADTGADNHSPHHQGFLYAHSFWFMDKRYRKADLSQVPDLAKYPELIWLERLNFLPHLLLAVLLFVFGGWHGFLWGYCVSTVMVWHSTHVIQSLAHTVGRRRYPTPDESRNSWWLAFFTLGEGWHNNHHYYPASARAGFRWWEIDLSYYVIKVMEWLGLVWDVRTPSRAMIENPERAFRRFQGGFQKELGGLRRQLESSVDVFSTAEPETEDHPTDVTVFRQWLVERLDIFALSVLDLFRTGPMRLREAYAALHDEVVERGSRALSGRASAEGFAQWRRQVDELFESYASSERLLGPAAAMPRE